MRLQLGQDIAQLVCFVSPADLWLMCCGGHGKRQRHAGQASQPRGRRCGPTWMHVSRRQRRIALRKTGRELAFRFGSSAPQHSPRQPCQLHVRLWYLGRDVLQTVTLEASCLADVHVRTQHRRDFCLSCPGVLAGLLTMQARHLPVASLMHRSPAGVTSYCCACPCVRSPTDHMRSVPYRPELYQSFSCKGLRKAPQASLGRDFLADFQSAGSGLRDSPHAQPISQWAFKLKVNESIAGFTTKWGKSMPNSAIAFRLHQIVF